jgi:hypothetical protein
MRASLALAPSDLDRQIEGLSIVKLNLKIDDAAQSQIHRAVVRCALPSEHDPLLRDIDDAKVAVKGLGNQTHRIDDPEELSPLNLAALPEAPLAFSLVSLFAWILSSIFLAAIDAPSVSRQTQIHGAHSLTPAAH